MRGATLVLAIPLLAASTLAAASAAGRSLAVTVDDLPAQRAEGLPAERPTRRLAADRGA